MPVYQATEESLNAKISLLSEEDFCKLQERVIDERIDLYLLAEEVRIFKLRYGRLPSALNMR